MSDRAIRFSRKIELDLILGGDKRPILLDCAIDESLDVARVTGALYYLSAGFLTVSGCDSSSHLNADRRSLGAWKSLERLVRVQEASEALELTVVAVAPPARAGILFVRRMVALVKP